MTPYLTASPSCKELSIPERAVDKKTPHKGDRQQKECLTTHGWTITFTTSFTKTAADGVQTGGFNMRKEEYVDWLNSVDKEDRTDLMELEIADEMEYVFF